MTTQGSTENESRYRNLIESILRERLLFRNLGRFGPSNKTFLHHRIMDIQKYNSFKVQKNTSQNTLKCSQFLDILKSNYGHQKIELWISWIQHDFWISKNGVLDILKYTDFWISKNELWISNNRIMDILNSVWFLDIHKCILGYPKIHWFLYIQKWIMDIQNSNYGYPKFSMTFWNPKMSKNTIWISKNRFMDILKYIFWYP